ncbi:FkbM family methyltransferase [Thermostichus vulcanus]|uniref:FkbM family methyltransferase n=1 Tax=Thermostichus vulcanus str. 'Rupite' TaxID=2813851 RepID=A0ABT0C738_THEVL|nr:FkbM family methyltransferase [Thermostichus vulcanus]MCJ2541605.1 FkbM family methyltransferase [Thermostichus vulcanus str. 'Rupite']
MEKPQLRYHPRVLLSWEVDPGHVPPIIFSNNQLTLCTAYQKRYDFNYFTEPHLLTPVGSYDIYEFVNQNEEIEDKSFDLVVVWSSAVTEANMPYNTKKFGCPTVLLVGDTHHLSYPISNLLTYALLEGFDYIVSSYNRQHLHWFLSAGLRNIAWLPLISMYTVTHEWVEDRAEAVAFVGQLRGFHPRRSRLIKSMREHHVPLIAKTADRFESAKLYAESLVSFNCSLNGDFNLRNLEIISAGGFLLTDRLSPFSGLDEYLSPGFYCDTYTSESELLEKISYYLSNPRSAIDIAKKAYEKFHKDWHPVHRINDLLNWIYNGFLPDVYSLNSDARTSLSLSQSGLAETRLAIYEPIQEIHRVEERVKVFISGDCPEVILADLLDLPRLDLYLPKDFTFLKDVNLPSFNFNLANNETDDSWDVLITDSNFLEQNKHLALKFKFLFVLGDEGQLLYSNAERLMKVRLLRLSDKPGLLLRIYDEDSMNYVVEEIFNRKCYPILDFVPDVQVIVDIGANIGLASAYFRMYYPDASIHCFECDPSAIHLLKQNALEIGNCQVHPVGLYSDDVDKVFYTGLQTTTHGSIHKSLYSGFPRLIELKKASSYLDGLDLNRIDILKIDTEGCELQILKTLFDRLNRIKLIYLEFHSEEDRRLIDQLLGSTHILWRGNILDGHRGEVCYLNRNYVPCNSPIQPLGR